MIQCATLARESSASGASGHLRSAVRRENVSPFGEGSADSILAGALGDVACPRLGQAAPQAFAQGFNFILFALKKTQARAQRLRSVLIVDLS